MKSFDKTAWIALTARGVEQARLLRERLRLGEIHRPSRYGPVPNHGREHSFDESLAGLVPRWFERYDHLVFFLAAGAAARLIAPCLKSKKTDPGVIVIDESGRFVVPILAGHEGGANAFARRIAGAIGAIPVVTTGSDTAGGFDLFSLEERFGWVPDSASAFKTISRAILDQRPIAVVQEIGGPRTRLDPTALPDFFSAANGLEDLDTHKHEYLIWITDRIAEPPEGFTPDRVLRYRPKSLILGIGCERGIATEAVEEGIFQTLREAGYAFESVRALASIDLKADEPGLLAAAERFGWETIFFDAEQLATVRGIVNRSETVEACVGTPGVAEPAALRAAGVDRLLLEKRIVAPSGSSKRLTLALARASDYRRRSVEDDSGRVIFIGAGPGDPDLLAVKADREIRRADVLVYAGSLVSEEIVRRAPIDATLHDSAPLNLEEVGRIMIEAARAGKRVVRLQSGDLSLYSAIQEQMNLLDEAGVPFELVPGISSYQAAASALKSEFTLPEVAQTIILTRAEGKTKMPDAESLESLAAHRATICVFLSASLAQKVQERLSTAYPPDTPTAILYRVSWPDEEIVVTTLDRLASTIRERRFSRTTLIIVGEAIGGGKIRSKLYDKSHAHIFRRRTVEAESTAIERDV